MIHNNNPLGNVWTHISTYHVSAIEQTMEQHKEDN